MTAWWLNYEVDPVTGCWLWLGDTESNGYGYRKVQCGSVRKNRRIHREMWERVHGPLAPGEDVHHKCRVKRCMNPGHFEKLGTVEHRRLHGLQKLTMELVIQMRQDKINGLTTASLAIKYGICKRQVRKVVSGQEWRAVPKTPTVLG